MVVEELAENCCDSGMGQYGNLEQGEHLPLDATTRGLVQAQQTEET
jgi:hypothetical protein